MPIYSRLISDKEILLKLSGKYKSVFLFACAGCMNESLAFDSRLPIVAQDGGHKVFPAIEAECKRLQKMLAMNGILAGYKVIPTGSNSRCIINLDDQHDELVVDPKFEAVLVLSCPSGFLDISKHSPVPSFIISEQIGSINYCYEEVDGCRKIINGKMTVFGE